MLRFLLTTAALLLTTSPCFAIQQRTIESVMPRGGARGTTVEVVIQGMDLDEPREILFYRPGVKAVRFSAVEPLEHPRGYAHGGKSTQRVKAQLEIAPDCPAGEHPFRLRTAGTLSTLATFWVTPFPIVKEKEGGAGGNDTREKAEPVAMNSTIVGRLHEAHDFDRDLYRVEAKKGERIAVEVDALRLSMIAYGDAEYDVMVRVLDASGKEVARNDDGPLHMQDPLLSLLAPADGPYFVEVRQRSFKPFDNGWYHLHVGNFARPLAVYPAGGPAGEAMQVQVLGDAAGATKQTVRLPKGEETWEFFPGEGAAQPPSPLPMRVSPYANALEAEPNDEPAQAPAAADVPVALNGVVSKSGDVDLFRLRLKKGELYRVRVFARGLGTSVDPKVWLRPADADAAAPPEFTAEDSRPGDRDLLSIPQHVRRPELLDPCFVFTPKLDGDYLLGVEDERSFGGPTSVYRVEVEPAVDGVLAYVSSTAHDAFETNRETGFIVPRGAAWTVNVTLGEMLGNRYKGELKLEAVGLPPGVRMTAPVATPGMRVVPVQFEADAEAAEQAVIFRVLARPADGKEQKRPFVSGSQQAVPYVNHSGGDAWRTLILDRYALAVVQPPPFRLEVVPPTIALAQSGELGLRFRLIRQEGFREPVDVLPEWFPPGVAGESAITLEPGKDEAVFHLTADSRARPGVYRFAVEATTTGGLYYSGVGRRRVSSGFVDLRVGEPYVAVDMHRSAVERGKEGEIVCDVRHLKPFSGEAVGSLRQLPRGVRVVEPLPRIKAGDAKLVFRIAADVDALAGQYDGVVSELTVEEGGQSIRQDAGRGVLRIDAARAASPQK